MATKNSAIGQYIKYLHQGVEKTARIAANKGVCWQTEEGTFVQKKLVIAQWDEPEDDAQDEPQPDPAAFAAALNEITKPRETSPAPRPVKAEGVEVVTLKQLCFDLGLEPRIARRRLRKLQGLVGTGSRWEWLPDSAELATVRKALATPAK